MKVDYIVVGAGITGATIARLLADARREVLVVDRRPSIGGNIHDHIHPSGIRVHTYGPHYFRTNSGRLWQFVNRFSHFYKYEAEVKTLIDDQLESWPITISYIQKHVGSEWTPASAGSSSNFEQASLSMMPPIVYEKFVRGYTAKQWGVDPQTLSASLARRLEVRQDDDTRLMRHKYQGIPIDGYTGWISTLLKGIPVLLNTDYLSDPQSLTAKRTLLFTGPIDEFFSFDLGYLRYRGQRREHRYHPDVVSLQPCGQINNPSLENGAFIRTLEWKHMMPHEFRTQIRGSLLTTETPIDPVHPDQYEYPFPDDANAYLYQQYRKRADSLPAVRICGRLGEYRYYDMDQAMGRAIIIARELLGRNGADPLE